MEFLRRPPARQSDVANLCSQDEITIKFISN